MKSNLTLIKGDDIGPETDYRDALPVNMVGILKPVLGAQGYMLQAPGLVQYGTTTGVSRGALWNERFAQLYRVDGNSLVSVSSDGVTTVLGTISGSNEVAMPYSFNTQGIVADGRFWLDDPSSGFREVTDPDLGDPIDCVWVDGYYFFTDGEFIYHTNIGSEETIDPLKFATAEFMPDKTLGVDKTQDNKVMVFGRYSIEYFVNAATDNFAFQRVATRGIKIGIVGTHAKVESGGKHYILGGRKEECISVHAVTVGNSNDVATREVQKIIGQYSETELADVRLETYKENEYTYIIVHLPNECLIFNETLAMKAGVDQAWSIFKSDVNGDASYRAKHFVFDPRVGSWVCGDKREGILGRVDASVSTHYGEIAEWILYTPFIDLERQSINELEVETIPGFTTTDDATVFLSMTYNGVTHGKEVIIPYGDQAQYNNRFILRRLGEVSDWFAFKLRGATRSRMAFGGITIDHG